jgi:hypothetical protein
VKFTYLVLIGAVVAILIEVISLRYERWEYSEFMLVIPEIEVGIIPVVQMIVLPFLSFFIGSNVMFNRYILRHGYE